MREAIVASNLNSPFSDAPPGDETGDRIVFSKSIGSGTLSVTEGEFTIEDDLIIRGRIGPESEQTSLSGESNTGRIFRISTSQRVYMRDLTFESSSSEGNGGVGFLDNGSDAVFANVNFRNASSGDQGGALFLDNAKLKLTTAEFTENFAFNRGGAIAAVGRSVVVANQTVFGGERVGNESRRWGGAISITDDSQLISNSDFLDNRSGDGGGAINAIDQTRINIFGGNFVDNRGTAGGGVEFQGDSLYISNATFSNNDGTAGGALSVSGATSVILNSTFDLNTGGNVGGAIVVKDGSLMYVQGSSFEGHFSTTGGTVWISDSKFVLRGSRIESSTSSESAGAILLKSRSGSPAELRVVNSELNSNIAQRGFGGGAIAARGGLTVITNSSFDGNMTDHLGNGGGSGGAIHTANDSRVLVSGSEFTNNESGHGGAIFHQGDYFLLSDSELSSNSSNEDGGGVFTGSRLAIANSTISQNVSTNGIGGGVFATSEATLVLREETTFSANSAMSGGAVGVFDSRAYISDTRFQSNVASLTGGAITFLSLGNSFITASTFFSNTAGEHGSAIDVKNGGQVASVNSRYESNQINSDSESGVVRVELGGVFNSYDDVFENNFPNNDISN
ncbi:hypothetical protein [Mariniblastus fucicola]|nr:hypothetical protein [Mariniblastus fucicola]